MISDAKGVVGGLSSVSANDAIDPDSLATSNAQPQQPDKR
jgi:hypothetical protein